MKHKIGDIVRVKSNDWWEKSEKKEIRELNSLYILCGKFRFLSQMKIYLGSKFTISKVFDGYYSVAECNYFFTDQMFEN